MKIGSRRAAEVLRNGYIRRADGASGARARRRGLHPAWWEGIARIRGWSWRGLWDGFGEVPGGLWVVMVMVKCKKMQKKCKKMQEYLHIWKKSSIFASDLGIVPTATI